MKITVDVGMMNERFKAMDRDYYSYEGLETLLTYYNEIDENMELDVIAICCECTEYGENCSCSFDDLIDDYGYKYSKEDYMEDNDIEEEDFDEDYYINALIDVIMGETTVLRVFNGNYIVFSF